MWSRAGYCQSERYLHSCSRIFHGGLSNFCTQPSVIHYIIHYIIILSMKSPSVLPVPDGFQSGIRALVSHIPAAQ
jgi:hypothetical protein